ncbi:MAG: putative DNA-binding domain-containing protein [Methylotenera sp.]
MLDFQHYQIAFTAHLRNPSQHKKPARVADSRMAIYREIVFNNIFGSVSACYPVCKSMLGAHAWRKLVRQFFAYHQANSPIFREIPQQFLQFINDVKDLPAYLQQLAHYEWVELAVNSQQTTPPKLSKKMDLLNEKPILAPANMLLEYDYPVHKISKRNKPKTTEKTYLLVFRNNEHRVKFIELNPMTFQLLTLIQENEMTGKQALTKLAEKIGHPDTEAIIQFGKEILTDLANQQAIIGSIKIN